jgi:hypothetical protein
MNNYNQAISIDPQCALGFLNRGIGYLQQGREAESAAGANIRGSSTTSHVGVQRLNSICGVNSCLRLPQERESTPSYLKFKTLHVAIVMQRQARPFYSRGWRIDRHKQQHVTHIHYPP